MLRVTFLKTAFLSVLLFASANARAELYVLTNNGFSARYAFRNKVVSALKDGDDVRITGKDGNLIEEFHLVAYINEGELGRVFQATNQRGEIVAVKFPKNDSRSFEAMQKENIALSALKDEKTVPYVEVTQYEPEIFIEKEYLTGGTLTWANVNWKTLSVEEKSERLEGLHHFVSLLNTSPFEVQDLHSGNIIWDSHLRTWKVLDPGAIHKAPLGRRPKLRFILSIENHGSPEMKDALSLALKYPEWTARFIRLQDEVARIKSFDDLKRAAEYFARTPVLDGGEPFAFQKLFNEGLARTGLIREKIYSPQAIETLIAQMRNCDQALRRAGN